MGEALRIRRTPQGEQGVMKLQTKLLQVLASLASSCRYGEPAPAAGPSPKRPNSDATTTFSGP